MPRLLVHVEGQTEESFVNVVLAPHLYGCGYTSVSARLLGNARQRTRRGGIRSWESVRDSMVKHLRADRGTFATTMVDYYGLSPTWPGRIDAEGGATPKERAASVERGILEEVSNCLGGSFDRRRLVPYVVMHEFEGLLFSDADRFAVGIGRSGLSSELEAIRSEFRTPEEIDDSPDSAPSRRVLDLWGGYQKPLMGVRAAMAIGIDGIRSECPLFNGWIGELEQRAELG